MTETDNPESKKFQVPEFTTYEEEAAFWDGLDTAPFMENDGEWFRFETPISARPATRSERKLYEGS